MLATHGSAEGDRCVDIFSRPDKTFGFAQLKRDTGPWTPIGGFADLCLLTAAKALGAAKERVNWLSAVLEAAPG